MHEIGYFFLGVLASGWAAIHWKLMAEHESFMRKLMEKDARFQKAMSVRYYNMMHKMAKKLIQLEEEEK